jgi:hypothetical protein
MYRSIDLQIRSPSVIKGMNHHWPNAEVQGWVWKGPHTHSPCNQDTAPPHTWMCSLTSKCPPGRQDKGARGSCIQSHTNQSFPPRYGPKLRNQKGQEKNNLGGQILFCLCFSLLLFSTEFAFCGGNHLSLTLSPLGCPDSKCKQMTHIQWHIWAPGYLDELQAGPWNTNLNLLPRLLNRLFFLC